MRRYKINMSVINLFKIKIKKKTALINNYNNNNNLQIVRTK